MTSDGPDLAVDCGHCITQDDRCSDESDRNCMGNSVNNQFPSLGTEGATS